MTHALGVVEWKNVHGLRYSDRCVFLQEHWFRSQNKSGVVVVTGRLRSEHVLFLSQGEGSCVSIFGAWTERKQSIPYGLFFYEGIPYGQLVRLRESQSSQSE